MPTVKFGMLLRETKKLGGKVTGNHSRKHQDHIASKGTSSEDLYAMVHKPIPIPAAMKIPKAREAIDIEWDKLEKKRKAWDLKGVQPRAKVMEKARTSGKTAHFGQVKPLCHQKNLK